jgi:glyoxylase-like metal-dependent hydrolase (beta-lactamase superfamily II)
MAELPIKATIIRVTPFQQNCTLVWCAKTMKAALIDPGGEVPRLLAVIDHLNLTLDRIWVTHGHVDHASGVSALVAQTGVPVEGPHIADKFLIDRLPEQGPRFGITAGQPFTPDRWLQDGDTVTLGETTWEVFHCPGHTPGHVVFFNREARFAQVGDVLFKGSIGRTDLPGGNFQQLVEAITQKLLPLGDDVAFVPGHDEMSTFGAERKSNPFVSDLAIESMNL